MRVKGDLEIVGQVSANNLSGTNTGDQDLSGYVPYTVLTDVQDPTGFNHKNPVALGTISFDNGTRTFTHALNGGDIEFYQGGVKYNKTVNQTVVIPNTEGLHFLYYNNSQVLISSQVPWIFGTNLTFVAIVYWSVTLQKSKLGEERHGISMDWATHRYLHLTQSAIYVDGFTPSVTIGTGSVDADAELQLVTQGSFFDEDILNQGTDQTSFEIWYLNGSSWEWDTASAGLVKNAPAGRAYFNEETTPGIHTLTEITNADFICMHLFATNTIDTGKSILVMGQVGYLTVGAARLGAESELANLNLDGLPAVEFVPIATFIIQSRDNYSNIYKSKVIVTDLGDDYIDWRINEATALGGASASDHGALSGLGDDDHLQYHNDTRALTWLGTRTADNLPEGATNKYNVAHPLVETAVPLGAVFTDTIYTLPFADNSTNWNTAFGWGDHAVEGYLTSTDLNNVAYTNIDNSFSAYQSFNAHLGIDTTDNNSRLNIGSASGTSGKFSGGLYPQTGTIIGDFAGIDGIQMQNKNSGSTSEFRFLVSDDQSDAYLAFSVASSTNTSLFFGQQRKDLMTILGSASTTHRHIAIGSYGMSDVILGTNNTERLRISSTGESVFTGTLNASNLSGTNTGDNAVNSLYSGLVSNATHTGEVTGSTALTIASGVVDIDNLANELKATITLGNVSGTTNIDFSLGIQFNMTLTAATTLTITNPQQGKMITLIVSGDFTLAIPATVNGDISGFDGTLTNQLQIYCLDETTPIYSVTLLNW